jgi:hypothetical protein
MGLDRGLGDFKLILPAKAGAVDFLKVSHRLSSVGLIPSTRLEQFQLLFE